MRVGHPQFLPLIEVGRTLQKVHCAGKRFGRPGPELPLISKATDRTRLIMVAEEKRQPAMVLHHLLPVRQCSLELRQVQRAGGEFVIPVLIHI